MKTSAQELFLQANQCYSKQEYQNASQLYEKIPQKSAVIWYNLGNCAYKNGKELEALLYWKRAQKNGDSAMRNDSSYNCAVVSKKLNITQSSPPLQNIPPLPLQILFFCTFSVFLVFNRKLWRAKKFVSLAAVALLMIASGALTVASYRTHASVYALVMHDACSMYAGPDSHYHEIAQIPQASELVIKEKKDGWCKISWSDYTGWIQNSNIEVI